ncbi:MAG: sugar ABC transporter substrate-binding protein, partial [Candidatus Electrothrix sp. AUS4]|nr:sugar ABC transporter substrate-binding protein [Candidatus Electrothrix sp. AUS4]
MRISKIIPFIGTVIFFTSFCLSSDAGTKTAATPSKKLVYLVSDQRIPFWDIMWRGCKAKSHELGYEITSYSAENNAKAELQFTARAIKDKVAGIIVSPTNSSACVTILKLARQAGIPVVISDIGTEGGSFVSFISSDNEDGAYKLGKILARKMHKIGWQDGKV